jgi:hypothetical protein
MTDRTVTDSAGRTWTCVASPNAAESTGAGMGKDVVLSCSTPSVDDSVNVTVGWQWESMSENGLARLITQLSPVPRR